MPLPRSRLVALAALAVASLATPTLVACGGTDSDARKKGAKQQPFQQFRTRGDLRPAKVDVTIPGPDAEGGYVFIAPKKEGSPSGPAIVDGHGDLVWFHPVQPLQAADFRVQEYRGEPVLTWWEGTQPWIGVGHGTFVIMDNSYRRIAEFGTGNGVKGDLHELLITPENTALVAAYVLVRRDLTEFGGPKRGHVFDSVVQEIDIESGRVLFEWRSLDHVPLAESAIREPAKTASRKAPFDYFHVNALDIDDDGNLLVSARNTHGIYKIDRRSGDVIWRLGGSASDFKMGEGTKFGFQHDARRHDDGTISIFDNSAAPPIAKHSRALVLRLDEEAMTAELVREYVHPQRLLAPHQGNAQRLENGDFFVGWGGKPYFTQFSEDGDVLFDAKLAIGDTYRAYRFDWTGRPADDPAVAVRRGDDGVSVYASWNGATDVASWQVLAGPDASALEEVETVDRDGFETRIEVDTDERYVAVRALDDDGNELGTSRAVSVTTD